MTWVLIIGLVFLVIQVLAVRKNKRELENLPIDPDSPHGVIKKLKLQGEEFTSFNGSCTAILDQEKREVHIFSRSFKGGGDNSYTHQICNFSDIISSEVVIDSETVTSTARGSQLGGAIVGGALLGGVGALVGALSGKTVGKENIKEIDIKLTIDDINNPVYKINFLNTYNPITGFHKKGFKKDNEEYKQAILAVEKWQGMFDVILNDQKVESSN